MRNNPLLPRLTGRHVPNRPQISNKNVLKTDVWSANFTDSHVKRVREQKNRDDAFLKDLERMNEHMLNIMNEEISRWKDENERKKIVVFHNHTIEHRNVVMMNYSTEEMKRSLESLGYKVISPTEGI